MPPAAATSRPVCPPLRRLVATTIVTLAAMALTTSDASAQSGPLQQRVVDIAFDSGPIHARRHGRSTTFAHVLEAPDDAMWMRLRFDKAVLGDVHGDALVRITSLLDGGVQVLDRHAMRQWRYTSAYFNGNQLLIEVISDAEAGPSRIVVSQAWVSANQQDGQSDRSICDDEDFRSLSEDARIGRLSPDGCTAWLINDATGCMITAGHCGPDTDDVVQFNVPLSNLDGSWNHPPPEDQYVVDSGSVQSTGSSGPGNDWAYFGCHPNSTSGLLPREVQVESFDLASPFSLGNNPTVQVTGYGSTSPPRPPEWNFVQKSLTGPVISVVGTLVEHRVDTTAGNSGSPIIHKTTGQAVGIHTHGGCLGESDGSNAGTGLNHVQLVNAIGDPQGVCAGPPPITISFAGERPITIDPSGDAISIEIAPSEESELVEGSATLHYDLGQGMVEQALMESVRGGTTLQAPFPAATCGQIIRYYISAQDSSGHFVTAPAGAPDATFQVVVAGGAETDFLDTFEDDQNWSVSGRASAGHWDRGIPMGTGLRADPSVDGDESGQCYLTGNAPGDTDVDNGNTVLTSSSISVPPDGAGLFVSYMTWLSNNEGAGPENDPLVVDYSFDDGQTWLNVETIGPSGPQVGGGWFHSTHEITEFGDNESAAQQLRLRFSVADEVPASLVEAAVDGVRVFRSICTDSLCPGDVDGDNVIGVSDLIMVIINWGQSGPAGDATFDGVVNVADLLHVINNWGTACN